MRDEHSVEISNWQVQLRKGAAELAVLGTLYQGASYGSKLVDTISSHGRLEISEGAIYPLLKRLERDGKVTSEWIEDDGATHPRKYYKLTSKGQATVETMREEWMAFSKAMTTLITQTEKR